MTRLALRFLAASRPSDWLVLALFAVVLVALPGSW